MFSFQIDVNATVAVADSISVFCYANTQLLRIITMKCWLRCLLGTKKPTVILDHVLLMRHRMVWILFQFEDSVGIIRQK